MTRAKVAEADRPHGVLSDVMRVGLLLLDSEGVPVFANRLTHELLGCDADDLAAGWERVRRHLELDTAIAGVAAAGHAESGVAESGQAENDVAEGGLAESGVAENGLAESGMEWRLVGPPITTQPLQLELIPLRGRQLAGAAVLLKDGAADEVLAAELLLASRMRAQNYIFSSLLSDLRAPLHALEINLELLGDTCHEMRGDFDAGRSTGVPRRQSDQIVAVLKEELARLNRSLRTVLDHGSPQPPALADVDLAALLRELAVLLRSQARRQSVSLELQIGSPVVFVHGQRDQIRQALLNLAINALEAMPGGGALTIALQLADGQARVTVTDTGPGIPPELLDRAQRVYSSRPFSKPFSTKPMGTGMGLFVTRLVASAHGGQLEVGNRHEGGAAITLALPPARLRAATG